MTDARKLFRSSKRYRGFAQVGDIYTPVSFSVYTINSKEVRLKYIFPTRIASKLHKGTIIYVLIEDDSYMIGELRVLREEVEAKSLLASLDFVTKDRRKLPRVKLRGLVEVEVELLCGGKSYKGQLIDVSMVSIGVELKEKPPLQECEVILNHRGQKIRLKGRVVKNDGTIALELEEGNGDIANFLSKIYSEIFLKVQRSN